MREEATQSGRSALYLYHDYMEPWKPTNIPPHINLQASIIRKIRRYDIAIQGMYFNIPPQSMHRMDGRIECMESP